jgi:hypothetical protein
MNFNLIISHLLRFGLKEKAVIAFFQSLTIVTKILILLFLKSNLFKKITRFYEKTQYLSPIKRECLQIFYI